MFESVKANKKLSLLIFISVVSLFFLSNVIFQRIIYGVSNYNEFLFKYSDVKSIFWQSSFGISVKVIIDIVVVIILLKGSSLLLEIKLTSSQIVRIVCFSYLIFLVQMFAEFLYIITFYNKDLKNLESFSFLSISFFLDKSQINIPYYLRYCYEVLGFFELIFWILLSWLVSKYSGSRFWSAFKFTTISYIVPLSIWLMFVVIIVLLKIN